MFLFIPGFAFFGNKRSAIRMIKEICINSRYYPEHYCAVPRWIKKCFKVKEKMIPKFIYFEFCMSVFFAVITPIYIVIALFLYAKHKIEMIYALYILNVCIVLIDDIYFTIMSLIYKYNRKEKGNDKK